MDKTLLRLLPFVLLSLFDGTIIFFPWAKIAYSQLRLIYSWLLYSVPVSAIELVSYFSQSGLHGEVHFAKSASNSKLVRVRSILEATIQYPEQSWTWGVHQNPVDYSIIDPVERCSLESVGEKLIDFDDLLGYLELPGNESSVWDDVMLSLTGEIVIGSVNWKQSKHLNCILQAIMDCGDDR